jgi:hypothetical protein
MYLNVAPSTIPSNVMGRISDILAKPDDTVNGILYHTNLVGLINANLTHLITSDYAPVYLELGNVVFGAEQGVSPATRRGFSFRDLSSEDRLDLRGWPPRRPFVPPRTPPRRPPTRPRLSP